jgi:hypothetical protein
VSRRSTLTFLILILASAAEAGPWATGKGHFYSKVSYQFLRSMKLAAPDGTQFQIPRFTKKDAGLFLTYGTGDRFSVLADVPALRSSDLQGFGRETGVGDLRLGVQAQLGASGPWVFALRATVQAPTGDVTRAEGLLPTGSGVWEGEGVLGVGRSLGGGGGYGFLEVGPEFRGGGLRNGFVYNFQIGWNVLRRLVLAANLRGVQPYTKAPPGVPIGSAVGVSDRVTYAAYGPTAIVKVGRDWALQFDVDEAFHTRNLAVGTVFRVGVAFAR